MTYKPKSAEKVSKLDSLEWTKSIGLEKKKKITNSQTDNITSRRSNVCSWLYYYYYY